MLYVQPGMGKASILEQMVAGIRNVLERSALPAQDGIVVRGGYNFFGAVQDAVGLGIEFRLVFAGKLCFELFGGGNKVLRSSIGGAGIGSYESIFEFQVSIAQFYERSSAGFRQIAGGRGSRRRRGSNACSRGRIGSGLLGGFVAAAGGCQQGKGKQRQDILFHGKNEMVAKIRRVGLAFTVSHLIYECARDPVLAGRHALPALSSLWMLHELYLRRAFELALRGSGRVAPNPMVGAVLVHAGRIIGEGWHARYGEAHAEVNCLNSVAAADKKLIPHSTMYVTLEPCAHYGKQPPCALRLIQEKVKKVVIATHDSFARVNGKGIQMLQAAGVEVAVLENQQTGRWLNRRFFTAHE